MELIGSIIILALILWVLFGPKIDPEPTAEDIAATSAIEKIAKEFNDTEHITPEFILLKEYGIWSGKDAYKNNPGYKKEYLKERAKLDAQEAFKENNQEPGTTYGKALTEYLTKDKK